MAREIIVEEKDVEDMTDELLANQERLSVFDKGEHLVNIWTDSEGNRVIMIQGVSSRVTVIRE